HQVDPKLTDIDHGLRLNLAPKLTNNWRPFSRTKPGAAFGLAVTPRPLDRQAARQRQRSAAAGTRAPCRAGRVRRSGCGRAAGRDIGWPCAATVTAVDLGRRPDSTRRVGGLFPRV